MNILESLNRIEKEIYDKEDKFVDLKGMYLKEDVDKDKLWEMITNNDVDGVIKMLEEDWEDADEEDWSPDDVEDLTTYLDCVDGSLEVNDDEDPKYVIQSSGESWGANTKKELMDDVRYNLNELEKVGDLCDESIEESVEPGQHYKNYRNYTIEVIDPNKNGDPQWIVRNKFGEVVNVASTDSYKTLDKILKKNGYELVNEALNEDDSNSENFIDLINMFYDIVDQYEPNLETANTAIRIKYKNHEGDPDWEKAVDYWFAEDGPGNIKG